MIICGTGHRPNKVGGYSKEAFDRLERLAYNWIHTYRPEKIISGGALGWDQALAQAAVFHGVPLVMALPFNGFECKWPRESQLFLHSLMEEADEIVYVCESGYAPWKMQERNKWMVDNSDAVLALWNGTPGGTANCVKYALTGNKEIINLWNKYEES